MSYEGEKRKTERVFLLSPLQYPDPVQNTEIIDKQEKVII